MLDVVQREYQLVGMLIGHYNSVARTLSLEPENYGGWRQLFLSPRSDVPVFMQTSQVRLDEASVATEGQPSLRAAAAHRPNPSH